MDWTANMPRRVRCLVVLDTMWGSPGQAPQWFFINPRNHTGKRLYRLTGLRFSELAVANACPRQVGRAAQHGKPDPLWLRECLSGAGKRGFKDLPLLVCGQVASRTFDACGWQHDGPVVRLKHPAARTWTKTELARWTRKLTTLLQEER